MINVSFKIVSTYLRIFPDVSSLLNGLLFNKEPNNNFEIDMLHDYDTLLFLLSTDDEQIEI